MFALSEQFVQLFISVQKKKYGKRLSIGQHEDTFS